LGLLDPKDEGSGISRNVGNTRRITQRHIQENSSLQ